jgi:hypothetical protein
VTWSSLNSTVATVNASTGVVTGVKAGTATIRATAADGSGRYADKTITVTAAGAKTVLVGAPGGTMPTGLSGSAARVPYSVTLNGIADGTYRTSDGSLSYQNFPQGVSGTIALNFISGSATMALSGNGTQTAGTYDNLTLTIDGVTSAPFTLVIAPAKSVQVGSQVGIMTAGVANSSVDFQITTTSIANGQHAATLSGAPTGVSVQQDMVNIQNGSGTLTLTGNTTTQTGTTSTVRVTIDGVQSNQFTLVISAAAAKTVSVGAASGTLTAGMTGSINFPVTTTNITNGIYPASVSNLPNGVIVSQDMVQITGGSGTLTLYGNGSQAAGTRTNLWLTIDNTEAIAPFSFVVAEDPGNGTSSRPFAVGTVAQLEKVGSGTDGWSLSAHYRQIANIDLSGVSNWMAIGGTSTPFTGSYDGGGYTISRLQLSANIGENQGLFGRTSTSAVLRNVALTGVSISAARTVGGIAGRNSGTIQNCYVGGSLSTNTEYGGGQVIGGIAGYNDGTVENCYTTISISGTDYTGGIVGSNNGTIRYCYSTSWVSGAQYVGGISGNGGTVQNCVALNTRVRGLSNPFMGRVAGYTDTYSNFSNLYARNDMDLPDYATVTSDANGKDGADITVSHWHGATWWSQTSGAPDFSVANWNIAAGRLPHLKTTTGAAFNQSQTPAVQ